MVLSHLLHHQSRSPIESELLSALEASTKLLHLKQIHALILRLGFDQSSFLVSKLLRCLTDHKVPMDPYPHLVFSHVQNPNPFLWTALIRGYALLGPFSKPFYLYSLMRCLNPRAPPQSFTFSSLFKLCGSMGFLRVGLQLHGQKIVIGGFDSDLHVNNTLIDMYVGCSQLSHARKLFDEMVVRDVVSWTVLIVAYSKLGDMDQAGDLFEMAPIKDMVAWTAMVTGYVQNARPRDALRLFERMQEDGIQIDEVTLVSAISACAQLGAVTWASTIRDFAERYGYRENLVVGSAMVDMFGKCGLVDEACRVFNGMTERNVYTYSAMISTLAAHGRARDAIRLFEEMEIGKEVKPNGVTFVGLLTACSHAGMVEEGRFYFHWMKDEYRITPTANHYACMIDLLGRTGLVEGAYELIKSMPMEPHGGVWGALLGACRIHGNVRIAEIAANHLFKLEPHGIGNYVILSNIYASAGLWDKVLKVRKLMKGRELRKDPACSLVETKDGFVHEFFADDRSHPRTREIKKALDELMKRLKSAGYVPNLSSVGYDVSDAEKEQLLKGHSEKLALAFGLLTTGEGDTIRIMKNLRVCVDCHIVMCLVSSVMRKEIVLRDNMRFHHFQDGLCSCGGFW